jgi:hypothetical protein
MSALPSKWSAYKQCIYRVQIITLNLFGTDNRFNSRAMPASFAYLVSLGLMLHCAAASSYDPEPLNGLDLRFETKDVQQSHTNML